MKRNKIFISMFTLILSIGFALSGYQTNTLALSSTKKTINLKDAYKLYGKSTVVIEAYDKDEQAPTFGTGFSIGDGLFVTNTHVLKTNDAYSYKVVTSDGKSYPVEGIVKYDENKDIAVIKTKSNLKLPTLKYGTYKSSNKGQSVAIIGSPEGYGNVSIEGRINGIRNLKKFNLNIIDISAPVLIGFSGGPVINTYGEVIGMSTIEINGTVNPNYAIAIDNILPWINELKSKPFNKITVVKKNFYTENNEKDSDNSASTETSNNKDSSSTSKDKSTSETSSSKTTGQTQLPKPEIPKSAFDIPLNFNVADAVIHPSKPIIFLSDTSNKKIYSINYETKEIQTIDLDLPPESLYIYNNELYVSLLKQNHSSYTFDKDQKGAIGIINLDTLKVVDTLDINQDPYDIVVGRDSYIYVTSGSGQWTKITSYSRTSKQEIGSSIIYQKSYAAISPIFNRIYTIDPNSTPRDLMAFNALNGKFDNPRGYDSPYHGDYPMTGIFKISPNGKYIFNGTGTIFTSGRNKQDDMIYVNKLNKDFLDISFDGSNRFFTSIPGGSIYEYNSATFEGTNTYQTVGEGKYIFYRNNKIISVSRQTTNQKNTFNYGIETINIKAAAYNNPEEVVTPDPITPVASTNKPTGTVVNTNTPQAPAFDIPLNFSVTDAVMNPNKPIIYISDSGNKKIYAINYETKTISSVDLTLTPESLDFYNNELYVALLKQRHDYYIWDENQKGAFCILDADTLAVKETLDVNIDPFDIIAGRDGNVYITSGSGQWTKIKSYSRTSKQELGSSSIRQRSYAILSPIFDRIYTIDTDQSTRNMEAYNISNGKFVDGNGYDSPYFGEYSMATNFKISPDGKYIFNGSGNVFQSGNYSIDDMKYIGKINKEFIDITFDGTNKFYTSVVGNQVYEYNYSNFEGINTYQLKAESKFLFYRNNKLISISRVKQGDSDVFSYGVEIVDIKK